jgi:hypothetical protein
MHITATTHTHMLHCCTLQADVTDLPLYCTTRSERGLVDMSTVQYFRPVSSDPQAPLNAFDVVTTDRDWALGAENPTALQVCALFS